MKTKNKYWLWAGIVNLFGAIVHLIGGQFTIVNPMRESNMAYQALSEMVGAWHMITIILFLTSLYLIRFGLGRAMN